MKFEIDIPDQKASNLSDSGKTALLNLGKKYLNEIIDEADRLEIVRNNSTTNSEITSAIITDAELYIKKYRVGKKPKRWIIFIQLIAFISTLITGGLFNIEKFNEIGYLIAFLITFFICTASTIILIVQGVQND